MKLKDTVLKQAFMLGQESGRLCTCAEPHVYYCREDCNCPCYDHADGVGFGDPADPRTADLWEAFRKGREAGRGE